MRARMNGMSLAARWACVLALTVGPTAGCSDLDGEVGTGGSGGNGGTGGTGGTDGTACPNVGDRLYFEFVDGADPLEGVRSCITCPGTEDCETSNAEGKLVLNMPPPNVECTYAHGKEGYEGRMIGGLLGENAFGGLTCFDSSILSGWVMHPDDDPERQALAAQLETPYPWEGGIVALRVVNPDSGAGLGGVTFVPVGSTADQVGHAFYYDAATQQYSLDLEETTAVASSWTLPLSQGGFTEVTPGVQEFEVIGAVGDCYGAGWAWPGDAPNRVRVPVRAGFLTTGPVWCDPP